MCAFYITLLYGALYYQHPAYIYVQTSSKGHQIKRVGYIIYTEDHLQDSSTTSIADAIKHASFS